MYQFEIKRNEAGQRLDKYLHKLMPMAPASFFYKMLRKKNIVLNGKKAEGKEKLSEGDLIKLFLSEETFNSFTAGSDDINGQVQSYQKAYDSLKGITVLFENEQFLALHKPAGILTQKAKEEDLSLNEWLIGYLLNTGKITKENLLTFKPSVCNRLDRNTSGIVLCGCNLAGSQALSRMMKDRSIRKFYHTFVKGTIEEAASIDGLLQKDEKTNKVSIKASTNQVSQENKVEKSESYIKTNYKPLQKLSELTYLEVELITGKTHQIRAHMASVGHPLLGDYKYGILAFNDNYKKKYGIHHQLLHASRVEIPASEALGLKEELILCDKDPKIYQTLLQGNQK
ncbi:MAG: RluA family pseudouridine synthase [Lachnospiraceae bacterium]|nr:RluA family pseudouridine synthase [Lachnospiraceae bacterium]